MQDLTFDEQSPENYGAVVSVEPDRELRNLLHSPGEEKGKLAETREGCAGQTVVGVKMEDSLLCS